jgi:fructose-bisphosphate aldolase class I
MEPRQEITQTASRPATPATDLARTAAALVPPGKGILAADETVSTLTKRFDALEIASTSSSRRDYRELLLTTPGAEEFISGAILQDETIHQHGSAGTPIAVICNQLGILPGIKVDAGTTPLAGHAGEHVTEGLDRLRERLADYRRLGARFAKWRAVFAVGDMLPSAGCVAANAEALARYAVLCQEQALVPIVEPEVLMDGPHTIERCEEVTGSVLHAVFEALLEQGVCLEGMLLKPNMVVPGDDCPRQADIGTVAAATLRCLRRHVPPAIPGVVFLSGGQRDVVATRHLDAINRAGGPKPWKLSFSYGRALQDAALATWRGKPEHLASAQRAFYHRARCNGLAALGAYDEHEEDAHVGEAAAQVPPGWRDD